MKAQSTILNFISDTLVTDLDNEPITVNDPLLTSGVLDSLTIMQLVFFLEEKFDVVVPPEHVTVENFQTVTGIVHYLDKSSPII